MIRELSTTSPTRAWEGTEELSRAVTHVTVVVLELGLTTHDVQQA
jgi:hypothetical protein